MQKIRKGRYIKTIIRDEHSDMEFHEVDNLDTKNLDQAENNYEKVFVTIRTALESNEQFCCDDEQDRLALTQVVTDLLKQDLLIRKD
jgi:transcription termination factor Rho